MTYKELLLTQLTEEMGEVAKNISKALRFGLDDGYPKDTKTNRERITQELTDVLGVIELLIEAEVLTDDVYNAPRVQMKKDKILNWMKYSYEMGRLDEDDYEKYVKFYAPKNQQTQIKKELSKLSV